MRMLKARQNLEIDQMNNFLSQKSRANELLWTIPYVKLVGLSSNIYRSCVPQSNAQRLTKRGRTNCTETLLYTGRGSLEATE